MIKKIFLVVIFLICVAGLSLRTLCAQKEPAEPPQTLQHIESRLEELTAITRSQKDLDKKLDRVLSNQEKIIAELGIIKVRASR
ncbi:MAG: hypothetical protein A2Y00_04915 [Omnitrophica WOR_2 bacterium GWF2_43_52]|nr:MAG: hypothetical protein A2Y01_05700 [Omnitrophica WOR_2 bacterium GWC2_44_8]OGX20449.1 MAG: hypothetical protein A2Y00_04915 [Omnitrophica WOR_2 bacterium GWF2_43_52]HAH20503.1 hypothetical protein [Candidatus Omnitrophota bacterium]HBG62952.1 hypothetical protein [Candidatus Omnitrophota bacterium]HCD38238.1 hypothetical protein [Candidatus Omnitrophota bacterium]